MHEILASAHGRIDLRIRERLRLAEVHQRLAASAIVQGLGMAATLLVGIQLARYLGPADYGVYGLVMAVVALASVGAQFGLPSLAVREAAKSISTRPPASASAIIRWISGKALAIGAVSSALLTLLILMTSPHWTEGRRHLIAYAGATIFLLSLFGVGIGLVRGLGRNLFGQIIETLGRPLATMIGLFLVYRLAGRLTVEDALVVQGAVILAAIAVIALILMRTPVPPVGTPDHYHPAGWIKTCLSLLSTTILSVLNSNYPLLVAGLFVSASDLGILRAALSSAMLVALPSTIANLAVGPTVAKLHQDGLSDELADTLSHTTIACFATTLCGMLVVGLAGRPLLAFMFGPEYVPAYEPLLVLGAAQLVVSAFGITGTYLNLTGKERLVFRATLLAVPLGLLISIPLTAAFGIEGATIGNLCMVIVWHWYVLAKHGVSTIVPISLPAAIGRIWAGRSEA